VCTAADNAVVPTQVPLDDVKFNKLTRNLLRGWSLESSVHCSRQCSRAHTGAPGRGEFQQADQRNCLGRGHPPLLVQGDGGGHHGVFGGLCVRLQGLQHLPGLQRVEHDFLGVCEGKGGICTPPATTFCCAEFHWIHNRLSLSEARG